MKKNQLITVLCSHNVAFIQLNTLINSNNNAIQFT